MKRLNEYVKDTQNYFFEPSIKPIYFFAGAGILGLCFLGNYQLNHLEKTLAKDIKQLKIENHMLKKMNKESEQYYQELEKGLQKRMLKIPDSIKI